MEIGSPGNVAIDLLSGPLFSMTYGEFYSDDVAIDFLSLRAGQREEIAVWCGGFCGLSCGAAAHVLSLQARDISDIEVTIQY